MAVRSKARTGILLTNDIQARGAVTAGSYPCTNQFPGFLSDECFSLQARRHITNIGRIVPVAVRIRNRLASRLGGQDCRYRFLAEQSLDPNREEAAASEEGHRRSSEMAGALPQYGFPASSRYSAG